MKKRGLESLIPKKNNEDYDEGPSQKESVFWVEVDKIKVNPYQPRAHFDEEDLDSLAAVSYTHLKEKDPVNALNDFFKPKFRVLPATLDNVNLCALLFNGEIVKGETNIDIPKHNSRIKKVFLDKKAFAFKESCEKLSRADSVSYTHLDVYKRQQKNIFRLE